MPPRGSLQQTPGVIHSPSVESLSIFDNPRRSRNTTRRLNNSTASAALSVHFNRALANSVDSIVDSILGSTHSTRSLGIDSHSSIAQTTRPPRPANSLASSNSASAASYSASLTLLSSLGTRLSSTMNTADANNETAPTTTDNIVDKDAGEENTRHSHSPSVVVQSSITQQATNQLMNNNTLPSSPNDLFGHDMGFDLIAATYAGLVAAGGILGYAKAGSIPSLAAGLTFGGILGIGAYLTSVNPSNYYLTFGTSAVLGGMMGHRFYNSGKFMPAGLIALLSLGMVARYSYIALNNALNKKHSP